MFLKCTTKEIPKRGKTVQNIQSKHIHKYIYGKGSQAKGLVEIYDMSNGL